MDASVLTAARTALAAGRRPWLVTVAASTGSTPQRPGAWMAVDETGLLAGTIGGGKLEFVCTGLVQRGEALPGLRHFSLNNRDAGAVGMICGGSTDLLFTPLGTPAALDDALAALDARQQAVFCLPADGSLPLVRPCAAPPPEAAFAAQGTPARLELALLDARRVFVVGGGHVGREVSRLLGQLGYRHWVVDDRPEFAGASRFPDAERVLCAPFTALSPLPAPTERDAVCIMTRGHEGDAAAVRWALGTTAGYIGLMGSRRKREKLFADLAAAGYADASQRITTPIGLAIGAETPAEIAVSVCAELVAFFHQTE